MATQQMHSGALKVATLAGLAGAGLGVLFAPRSGRETRSKIRHAGSNMKHQATEKLETAKHKVEERAQAAREIKDRAEQAMMAGKDSAKQKYTELKDSKSRTEEEAMPSDLTTNREDEV